jgi:hypothetical protein
VGKKRAALVVFLSVSTLTVAAAADSSSPADVAVARQIATEGLILANEHKCAEAVEKLSLAERLRHAPTTAGRLGECQIELGQLVAGTETLRQMLQEQLPPRSPTAFVVARERANRVLEAAVPRIAALRVSVAAPPEAKVTVTVDGAPLAAYLLDVDRPIDPGKHVIEAQAPGFTKAQATLSLRDGQNERVTLTLEVERGAPGTTPPAAPAGGAKVEEEEAAKPSRSSAFIAFGVGVVGLGAGTTFALLANGAQSDVDRACPGGGCAATSDSDRAAAYRSATAVSFAVAGTAIVVGTILLFTGGSPQTAQLRRFGTF